jgi:hypothetical protein
MHGDDEVQPGENRGKARDENAQPVAITQVLE